MGNYFENALQIPRQLNCQFTQVFLEQFLSQFQLQFLSLKIARENQLQFQSLTRSWIQRDIVGDSDEIPENVCTLVHMLFYETSVHVISFHRNASDIVLAETEAGCNLSRGRSWRSFASDEFRFLWVKRNFTMKWRFCAITTKIALFALIQCSALNWLIISISETCWQFNN